VVGWFLDEEFINACTMLTLFTRVPKVGRRPALVPLSAARPLAALDPADSRCMHMHACGARSGTWGGQEA
jgi:hypothetical protein